MKMNLLVIFCGRCTISHPVSYIQCMIIFGSIKCKAEMAEILDTFTCVTHEKLS